MNDYERRMVADDLAVTLTQAMERDTALPIGFTEGLSAHLEMWLRNKAQVALNDPGVGFGSALTSLYAEAFRRSQ